MLLHEPRTIAIIPKICYRRADPNFIPAIPPSKINVLLGNLANDDGLDLYLYRKLAAILDMNRGQIIDRIEGIGTYNPSLLVSGAGSVYWVRSLVMFG